MGKHYLYAAAVLIAALTASALLSSCSKESDDAPESISIQSQSEINISDEKFSPLIKEEMRKFYNNASRVYLCFTGYGTISLSAETTRIDGIEYQKVTEPGLSSLSDLEMLCRTYFNDEITESLMATKVGNSQLFIDYKGELYRFGGYAALLSYDGTEGKFELISASDDFASFSVTDSVEVYGTPVSASYVYIVEYIDGKPLFTDYKPLAQVLAETYDTASESGRFVISEYSEGMMFRDLANPDIEWVPLASYGQNAANYSFSLYDDELKSYIVYFWPGFDGERYVTLGMRPNNIKPDEFSELLTYRIVVKDNKITSVTKTDTVTSADVLENGSPYEKSLNGTYICKGYISGYGLIIYSISLFGDTFCAHASLDGTDATVHLNGTYSYDEKIGKFEAECQIWVYDNAVKKITGSGSLSGKLLYYNGFLHLVIETSNIGVFSNVSIIPLTFTVLDEQTAVASYLPSEAVDLLFCHKIFTSDVYLLSYLTEPNTVCVYYTSDGGDSFKKLDIEIPDNIEYETAEAVSAADGGGSGEVCFYVALKSGTEVKYLRYDNFAATDETNWLTFKTDGKYIAKEDVPGLT